MDKIFGKFLNSLKLIKNNKQLVGFLVLVACLILFIILIFGKVGSGYPLYVVIISSSLIFLILLLCFIGLIDDNYFEYLKTKDWNKRTNEWLRSQDQTKSPAYIASSNIRFDEGRKSAYKNCLKEIDLVQKQKGHLKKLRPRIEAIINSI